MDDSFWALIGLILFFAVIVSFQVPGFVTRALDNRADAIRRELEDARRLREEAQALLAEYQRKRRDAEKEAEDIVAQAKADAEAMTHEAQTQLEEMVARRAAIAEAKIAQAESQAVAQVRDVAANVAISAAETVLAEKATGAAGKKLIDESLASLKTKFN